MFVVGLELMSVLKWTLTPLTHILLYIYDRRCGVVAAGRLAETMLRFVNEIKVKKSELLLFHLPLPLFDKIDLSSDALTFLA